MNCDSLTFHGYFQGLLLLFIAVADMGFHTQLEAPHIILSTPAMDKVDKNVRSTTRQSVSYAGRSNSNTLTGSASSGGRGLWFMMLRTARSRSDR